MDGHFNLWSRFVATKKELFLSACPALWLFVRLSVSLSLSYSHLYYKPCPSVRWPVRRLLGRSFSRSVSYLIFLFPSLSFSFALSPPADKTRRVERELRERSVRRRPRLGQVRRAESSAQVGAASSRRPLRLPHSQLPAQTDSTVRNSQVESGLPRLSIQNIQGKRDSTARG